MRKIIIFFCLICSLLSACQKFDPTDLWTNINSLDKRVTELERLCKQLNTNINALQTLVDAVSKQDYITNISPIQSEGKVIGYTISFAMSEPITIYHGKDGVNGQDGQDGKPGQDGQTPVIGIRKDVDGIYYWTINGEWLLDDAGQKVRAEGKDGVNGQDGQNGNDGAAGQDGNDGAAGQDGVTPQLKIENGMWYVSYNNGQTWVEVGPATGSEGPQGPTGPQGPPGVGGDPMFQSVTQDDQFIYFTLAGGTKIQVPRTPASPITLTLGKVTGFTATFDGTVTSKSFDLKVAVYYSTTNDLTVYKNSGKAVQTEFPGNTFTVKLERLGANTTYYYFYEVVYKGQTSFSEIGTFKTGAPDSLEGWGDGGNIGGGI